MKLSRIACGSMKKVFFALLVVTLLVPCCLPARDWTKDPPWFEIPSVERVGVVGDVHAAFDQFAASLKCLGFAERTATGAFTLRWTGEAATLIFTGDFTDRGKYTKECYDAVMDLEIQAKKAGGRVIPLLGNHEILLLNGTVEKWANTLTSDKKQNYMNTLESFKNGGCDFHQAISPEGVYGSWIRRRPLFAIVNGFLFIHGGLAKSAPTRSELAADYRDVIDAEKLSDGFLMDEFGPLWIRDWWLNKDQVDTCLQKLGVRGVIFGHTVGALGKKGNINTLDNRLVGIDIGMTPAYGNSQGGGLLITIEPAGDMQFTAMYPDRPSVALFKTAGPVTPPETSRKKTPQSIPHNH
ncbi:MAG: metallophosphoesterase [Candidatus Ozemobacteraceae bacterium]